MYLNIWKCVVVFTFYYSSLRIVTVLGTIRKVHDSGTWQRNSSPVGRVDVWGYRRPTPWIAEEARRRDIQIVGNNVGVENSRGILATVDDFADPAENWFGFCILFWLSFHSKIKQRTLFSVRLVEIRIRYMCRPDSWLVAAKATACCLARWLGLQAESMPV